MSNLNALLPFLLKNNLVSPNLSLETRYSLWKIMETEAYRCEPVLQFIFKHNLLKKTSHPSLGPGSTANKE